MPHFTEAGFTTPAALATAIINKLRAAGLTPRYVNAGAVTDPAGSMTATKATFEVTPDPLVATQPWRVMVDATGTGVMAYAGTATQLTDAGATGGVSATLALSNTISASAISSFWLTVTSRGLAVMVYAPSNQQHPGVLVAQRPVHPGTGAALTTGTAPVFAVTTAASIATNGAPILSVVRESDVLSPSTTGSASAITEGAVGAQTFSDGAYWLVRPANIATNRFVYLEEMDLIQYAHANAFVAGATLPVTLYGEGSARTYQAGAVRAGTLRPLILVAGGGV
ncbi:hypothetical protein [Deinococcus soli (ex Cha et al. 2016)]|uniref:hypothetical protein n=1 Tax=Deinococcus soli (ex Cha et al. 2016) TaxID=1309411 RepID=UPI001667745C|nr:hypothetical protein [Deinococcus soli (ex Cha et al. 2016)]GGB69651.1 hypothetical protein GCM10008019_27300 [Deinococcus soli (ex Cha et al. 2016)]